MLSFGQTLIDVISTPLYAVTGAIEGAQRGKNPLESAAQNSLAWTGGNRPKTASDIIKAAGGEGGFWESLAGDILLDPLTYTPGVVVSAPIKAALAATRAGTKGLSAAAKGAVSVRSAGTKAGAPAEAIVKAKLPKTGKMTPGAAKAYQESYAKQQRFVYQPVQIEGQRSITEALNQMIASGAEAAYKGARMSIEKSKVGYTAPRIAKKEKKAIKKFGTVAGTAAVREADQIIDQAAKESAEITAEVVNATKNPEFTPQNIPVTDGPVRKVTPLEIAGDLKPLGQTSVKELEKTLKNADKVVRGVTATTKTGDAAIAKVKEILDPAKQRGYALVKNLDANSIKNLEISRKLEPGADPITLLRQFADSSDPVKQVAVNSVRNSILDEATGETLGKVLDSGTPWRELSKGIKANSVKAVNRLLFLAARGDAGIEQLNKIDIENEFGETVAKEFIDSGALNPATKTNESALKAVLEGLKTTTEKKYDKFTDLIAGLKSGDIIAPAALEKVLRAIDPEHKLLTKVDKAARSKNSYEVLRAALLTDGVNTVNTAKRNLAKANPETFMKSTDNGWADVAYVTENEILNGTLKLDEQSSLALREQATERLVRARAAGEDINRIVTDAVEGFGRGLASRVGQIFQGSEEGVSLLGENFRRFVTEQGKSEAFLTNQYNQYLDTQVTANLLGRRTYRLEQSAKKGRTTSVTRIDDFILRADLTRDVALSTFGVRPMYVRALKELKGDLSKAYNVFIDLGDVAKVFRDAGPESAALFSRMLFPAEQFPDVKLNVKSDSLSFQEVVRVAADALRSLDRGDVFERDALIKALQQPSPGKTWSKAYKTIAKENAEEFVDFIQKNAEAFKDIHISRLKAELADLEAPAKKFSDALIESFVGAYAAMRNKGITSELERHKIVEQYMLKSAAVADIFMFSNGALAREALRSTSKVFLELADLNNKSGYASEIRDRMMRLASSDPNLDEFYPELMDSMYKMYGWDHASRPVLPGIANEAIDSAKVSWETAKGAFEESVAKLTTALTPSEVFEWRKAHQEVVTQLDNARKKMGKAGMETDYWNGSEWVSAARYDRRKIVRELQRMPNRFVYTAQGVIDVARYLADGEVIKPTFTRYGTKHTAETKALWLAKNQEIRANNAANVKANAQEEILSKMDEIDAMYPDDPMGAVGHANDVLAQKRFDEGTIKVIEETPPAGATEPGVYQGASKYRDMAAEGVKGASRFAQKFQAGYGFDELQSYVFSADSTLRNAIATGSNVMNRVFTMVRKFNINPADFDTAISNAWSRNFTRVDDVLTDPIAEVTRQLGKLVDSTIEHAVTRQIRFDYLKTAFNAHKVGYYIPSWDEFTQLKNPTREDYERFFQLLPIGEPPAYLVNATDEIGRRQLVEWTDRKAEFMKKLADSEDAAGSAGLLQRVIAAVQHASSEMTLMDNFVEDFGPKNYFPGLSEEAAREAALKSGDFVKMQTLSSGFSLTKYLPEDAIFPKDIAKQFFAMERHYNYVMENQMGKWMQNVMGVLNFFKFTQTTARPGHWMTIIVGDTSTSLIRGTNPLHFIASARLSTKLGGEKFAADWKASGDEARWSEYARAMKAFTKGGRKIETAENGTKLAVGGATKVYSDEDLLGLLQDYNVALGDVIATDNMVMYAEQQALATGTDQAASFGKMVFERMGMDAAKAGARRAYYKTLKGPGDIVAYLGNMPRIATALDVMHSRAWGSEREMMDAVIKEVNTYHPTIQSLSPIERQKIRPLFSYYTWLRGAQLAFLKMATEHTATMLIPSKIFYNQALANEMEPGSIGNLWGNKTQTPRYLDFSTYGPTVEGPRGGMVYRPSILPLDVLDTWNIQFDPTKTVDKQTFDNLNGLGQTIIGKNMNMVFQPGVEFITGTDPSTGKPSTVKDIGTAADSLLSNIGTMQLFQGLGLYTPSNKGPESANPLTQRDRDLKFLNFFTGQRVMDVGTPSTERNAQSDYNARIKRMYEQLAQQQGE